LPLLPPLKLFQLLLLAHVVADAVACPPPSLPSLLPLSPLPSLLHDTFVANLFWPLWPLPSAISTATTNANLSPTITVNAVTAASIFTNVCLCFCHYPRHRFRMCHSHHNCRFCHSCC
jgi:hypothetical protein